MTWPFENDTSAITKKLAQRSFKANKLRNIVAVIAIVLTSMLFTSVTTLCVGAIQSIQTTILQIRGTSPSTGTSVNWIAIIAALFFIMIFVITGYLLIRNIFEISVVQEIKKYGLLRTIGTTEKQIKRIVYKQAFWLSIIGISIPMKAAIFVTSACHKAAHTGKFDYGHNFYAKDADALDIQLPTKDGKPDYDTMTALISAVQKLVIKDVVLYADRKIEGTRQMLKSEL